MHYDRRFVGYFMGTYQAILWAADPAGAACRFPKRQGNGDTGGRKAPDFGTPPGGSAPDFDTPAATVARPRAAPEVRE